MRAVVQRVRNAQVHVDDALIGECGPGVMILVCAMQGDTTDNADALVDKIAKLRIFKDDAGKMNRSLLDAQGSALVISQFTLAADTSRGNRPGFSAAAAPDEGEKLYDYFAARLAAQGVQTQTGKFGADMAVSLVNDGPVTIQIER